MNPKCRYDNSACLPDSPCGYCERDTLRVENFRLTSELEKAKSIKCDSMSCLRYVGEAVTLFYENGRLSKELAKAKEQIKRCQICPEVEHCCDQCVTLKEATDGQKEEE